MELETHKHVYNNINRLIGYDNFTMYIWKNYLHIYCLRQLQCNRLLYDRCAHVAFNDQKCRD